MHLEFWCYRVTVETQFRIYIHIQIYEFCKINKIHVTYIFILLKKYKVFYQYVSCKIHFSMEKESKEYKTEYLTRKKKRR